MTELHRVGFHVKSMDELKRLVGLGVNLVELKPDKMARAGDELYSFDGQKFTINQPVAQEISDLCQKHDVRVQLHLPYEKKNDPSEEQGLCYAVREHHWLLMERFRMVAELHESYKIGEVVVVHPPQIVAGGQKISSHYDGIELGRTFLHYLDMEIREHGWEFEVGLENMAAPKKGSITLGYDVRQMKELLGNTKKIGITVDSGHRLLSEDMSVAKLFADRPVISLHLHTNPGIFHEDGYEDDAHQFATNRNLKHFERYIKSSRTRGTPITCEVSSLSDVPDDQIKDYFNWLQHSLE